MTRGPIPYPVVVLAGGLGSRLGALTSGLPKSLVEVAGEPFVHHQLALLARRGAGRVVLCIGHLGEMVRDAVGDGSAFGLDVEYSEDGSSPRGTAGAVAGAVAAGRVEGPFFVLYGDSYLPCDLRRVRAAHESCGRRATMTVHRNPGGRLANNVRVEEGLVVRYDKGAADRDLGHIDYGLSVFTPDAFAAVPDHGSTDLAQVVQELVGARQLAAHEVVEPFFEVGSHAGLAELIAHLGGRDASQGGGAG